MDELDATLSGEVFRGLRGDLLASFHLESEAPPALGQIQEIVEQRLRAEASERHGETGLRLAGWRGGWQKDRNGRWEADIIAMRGVTLDKVGHLVVTVRVLRVSGSNWSFRRGAR